MILISIIGIAVFLAGATIGTFAVLVIGIRKDDRAKNLTNTPSTRIEAATRRALGVGVRKDGNEQGKE
jgi:hypothetical protein